MGIENVPRYLLLSSLIWKLIRPFALVVARNTRNTTIDDELIHAVDLILSSDAVQFEDKPKEEVKRQ